MYIMENLKNKATYLLLLVLCLSCRKNDVICIDNIEYEIIKDSGSVTLINGEIKEYELYVEYPIESTQASKYLRMEIIDDVDVWMFKGNKLSDKRAYDIPKEVLIDSLLYWIRNDVDNTRSKRLLSIKVLPSGVPGISSFQRTIDHYDPLMGTISYSVDNKACTGINIYAFSYNNKFDDVLLQEIKRQREDIIKHGITYDESFQRVADIRSFGGIPVIIDGYACYSYDFEDYYIKVPIKDIAECITPYSPTLYDYASAVVKE